MPMKRYIVELGSGADLHGQDPTEAAERAVRDAISRSCLCGLREILDLKDEEKVLVEVTVALPETDGLKEERILSLLPFGRKRLKVMKGGMSVPGIFVEKYGDKDDSIMVANAAVVVWVEV